MTKRLRVLAVCVGIATLGAAVSYRTVQARPDRISVEDFVEIQRLLWDNHMGYDFAVRDNGDMWTNTFLPDAKIDNDSGKVHLSGHEQIRRYATDPVKANPARRLRHWTSTFQVTPNAEGAILQAFYLTTSDDGKTGFVIGGEGRYESQVIKTKQGWKIKHHVIHGEGSVTAVPARTAGR